MRVSTQLPGRVHCRRCRRRTGRAGPLLGATADDGQATYAFDTADNGVATFQLYYPEGLPLVNVDIYQPDDVTVRDDDNEGFLAFAPSGLTLTASALSDPPPSPINDPLPTQTAGTSFPLHVAAYGTIDDDPLCGVIETYDGNAAGELFHVDVEARDSDGDTTPNFGRESVLEGVRVSSTGLVLPVGGRYGSANDVINGASFSLSGVGGRFANTSILFDEVGAATFGRHRGHDRIIYWSEQR